MSDASEPQRAHAADLTERVGSLLDHLGGRTAIAAQRFGPLPAQRLTITPARGGGLSANGAHPAGPEIATDITQLSLRVDEVFPAASLAKLPIAIELMRRVDMGQFDLRERIDTSDAARVGGAGVLDILDPTTRLTLGELCALMLVVSDNTAANIILDLVGMGEVNETMARLNLTRTKLARAFMDQAARAAGRDNVTSAGDMLALLSLIRGNALPGGRKLRETLAAQQSFSELTEGWLPPSATLAHKDGTLDGVVHDAGIVSGPGGVAMYCVLTAEQDDIPSARGTIGRIVRLLWHAWSLG